MKKLPWLIWLIFFLLNNSKVSASGNKDSTVLKVYIIRHGEKPKKGDNLSCAGLNRALALMDVLKKKVGKPDYTYVPTINTGQKTSSVRMFQTVTPFAVREDLHINSQFAETDSTGAAADVLLKRGVVLMVWEHGNIPPLARALGAPVTGIWNPKDFDSIWILSYTADASGNLHYSHMKIDQENINPTDKCK